MLLNEVPVQFYCSGHRRYLQNMFHSFKEFFNPTNHVIWCELSRGKRNRTRQ